MASILDCIGFCHTTAWRFCEALKSDFDIVDVAGRTAGRHLK